MTVDVDVDVDVVDKWVGIREVVDCCTVGGDGRAVCVV